MHDRREPLRILYVDHVLQRGGGEIVLESLWRNLDRSRFEPILAAPPRGDLAEQARQLDVKVIAYDIGTEILHLRKPRGGRNPVALLRAARALPQAAARLEELALLAGADLIHSNSSKDHLVASPAARRCGVPSVWHVHDVISRETTPTLMRLPLLRAARRSQAMLLCVSQAVAAAAAAQGIPTEQIRVVHNGVPDTGGPVAGRNWVVRRNADELLVGMIARLTPWKGQHIVLAAADLLRQRVQCRFVLVGDGLFGDAAWRSCLETEVKYRGLDDRVVFLGHRNDARQLLHEFDILVHASTTPEPFGLVLVEAMLAGLPVIAADAGGPREIVLDDETGLLVRPNDPAALAAAIARLAAHPAMRRRMGDAGRQHAETNFRADRMAAEIESLYVHLLTTDRTGVRTAASRQVAADGARRRPLQPAA